VKIKNINNKKYNKNTFEYHYFLSCNSYDGFLTLTKYYRLLSRKDLLLSKTIEFYSLIYSPNNLGQNKSGGL